MFKKIIIIILTTVLVLGVALSGITLLAVQCGDYSTGTSYLSDDSSHRDVLNKIRQSEKQGKEIQLSSGDINNIFYMYLKDGISKENITLKSVNVEMSGSVIRLYMPVKYKNFNLLALSEGSISCNNEKDKIVYTPNWFKIGKLSIPQKFVFKFVNKLNNKYVIAEDNKIEMDRKIVPLKISNLAVDNGMLIVHVDKLIPSGIFQDKVTVLNKAKDELKNLAAETKNEAQKQKINIVIKEIDKVIKHPSTANAEVVNKVTKELNEIVQEVDKVQDKKAVENIKEQIKNTDINKKQQALRRVNSELNRAAASLQTQPQKQIIYIMQGTISKLIENVNYNYNPDAASVRTLYNKLPASQKSSLKSAILSNVDSGTILDLRNAFGI